MKFIWKLKWNLRKGKIKTIFHNNKIPKEGSQCVCVSAILIKSVFRTGHNYNQVFWEEYNYIVKEKKMPEYITKNIEISSDSNREDSDQKNSNEEISYAENFNQENQI